MEATLSDLQHLAERWATAEGSLPCLVGAVVIIVEESNCWRGKAGQPVLEPLLPWRCTVCQILRPNVEHAGAVRWPEPLDRLGH
jgi:hypothetical protein